MADNKIKRGDLCAIGERHSSTMMHGTTQSAWTYSIGRVTKASRAGDLIKEAEAYRYGTEIRLREPDQGKWWQSYRIGPDYQARAQALLGQEWDNIEYMRDALSSTELPG